MKLILFGFLICLLNFAQAQTFVQKHGQLKIQGNKIIDQNKLPIQLRGMSLYWSQWSPSYYNYNTIKWLRDDWKINVIRAAMGVERGGYATHPQEEEKKVIAVVDAAISLGIYVIIDFHVHEGQKFQKEASIFFEAMAKRYGKNPHILYEIWNEPLDVSWARVIKPYHQAIIKTIRKFDPDNIIICGTRLWSQEVIEAAQDPLQENNIAYSFHFYANRHGQALRKKAELALSQGIALFVTEYGTTNADGTGKVNEKSTKEWWSFLDQNDVSYVNWSLSDIHESSAALKKGARAEGSWSLNQLNSSGQLVRQKLISKFHE